MSMTATYSPDDNKLRLYSDARLDAETYARVKAAGFKWAPAQKLFVAPMWTPHREDLLIELCGEVGDEDTSLVERAEERAERFENYSEKLEQDAERVHATVDQIASHIPFGQPILVGHHSERRARKDAERIENGIRKAVKLWETSKYWEQRAAGALSAAKYKELPAVRYRRIKGIESDKRKAELSQQEARNSLKFWQRPDLTLEQVHAYAGRNVGGGGYLPKKEGDRGDHVTVYDVTKPEPSGYYAPRTLEEIIDARLHGNECAIERYQRWIDHYNNRLTYERAMLDESGGIVADKHDLQVGGQVLNRCGEWSTILKINKAAGEVSSVSTNNKSYPRVIPVERIKDYRPPTAEQQEAATKATKLPPICNYPGEAFEHITQEQWDKKYKDYKGTRLVAATSTTGAHRVRSGMFTSNPNSFCGGRSALVFITDAKVKYPPTVKTEPEPAPELPPITKDLPTLERQTARIVKAREEREKPSKFDALAERVRDAKHNKTPIVQMVAAPQLFPTPPEIATQVVTLAGFKQTDAILEPSAGTGNLVAAILKVNSLASITAIEIKPGIAEQLRGRYGWGGNNVKVQCRDFLETNGELGTFDKIVMNPPFSNGADIKHIEHARSKLRPGGRLVAICANGPRQRERLQPIATEWHDLPAGSFAEQGTNVNAAIVVIDAKATEPETAGLLF